VTGTPRGHGGKTEVTEQGNRAYAPGSGPKNSPVQNLTVPNPSFDRKIVDRKISGVGKTSAFILAVIERSPRPPNQPVTTANDRVRLGRTPRLESLSLRIHGKVRPNQPGRLTANRPWIQSDRDFNPANPDRGHSTGPQATTPCLRPDFPRRTRPRKAMAAKKRKRRKKAPSSRA